MDTVIYFPFKTNMFSHNHKQGRRQDHSSQQVYMECTLHQVFILYFVTEKYAEHSKAITRCLTLSFEEEVKTYRMQDYQPEAIFCKQLTLCAMYSNTKAQICSSEILYEPQRTNHLCQDGLTAAKEGLELYQEAGQSS